MKLTLRHARATNPPATPRTRKSSSFYRHYRWIGAGMVVLILAGLLASMMITSADNYNPRKVLLVHGLRLPALTPGCVPDNNANVILQDEDIFGPLKRYLLDNTQAYLNLSNSDFLYFSYSNSPTGDKCADTQLAFSAHYARLRSIFNDNSEDTFDIIGEDIGANLVLSWLASEANPAELSRVHSVIALGSPLTGYANSPGLGVFCTPPAPLPIPAVCNDIKAGSYPLKSLEQATRMTNVFYASNANDTFVGQANASLNGALEIANITDKGGAFDHAAILRSPGIYNRISTVMTLDYFRPYAYMPQDKGQSFQLSGDWQVKTDDPAMFGRQYLVGQGAGARATLTFSGEAFSWLTRRTGGQGTAILRLNNLAGEIGRVNLNTTTTENIVWPTNGLYHINSNGNGTNTLVIEAVGNGPITLSAIAVRPLPKTGNNPVPLSNVFGNKASAFLAPATGPTATPAIPTVTPVPSTSTSSGTPTNTAGTTPTTQPPSPVATTIAATTTAATTTVAPTTPPAASTTTAAAATTTAAATTAAATTTVASSTPTAANITTPIPTNTAPIVGKSVVATDGPGSGSKADPVFPGGTPTVTAAPGSVIQVVQTADSVRQGDFQCRDLTLQPGTYDISLKPANSNIDLYLIGGSSNLELAKSIEPGTKAEMIKYTFDSNTAVKVCAYGYEPGMFSLSVTQTISGGRG